MLRQRSPKLLLHLFAASLPILLAPNTSWAQNRSAGGTSGLGGSSLGGSSFGGTGFGGSSFGGSSLGQSAFGGSSFGSGFGGTGGTFGTGGTTSGTTGGVPAFVGRGAETLFVGRGSGLQQLNTSASQQRSSRAGSSGDSGSSETSRPQVRVRLTASPELMTRVTRPTLSPQMVTRLRNQEGLAGVSVSTADGVTRLAGVVETESQRRLAEKILAIEPGVGQIENQLQLAGSVEEIPPATR